MNTVVPMNMSAEKRMASALRNMARRAEGGEFVSVRVIVLRADREIEECFIRDGAERYSLVGQKDT